MNPSITTWPASVPVMVLLWPAASSATANRTLAAAVPRSGASVRYATRIQSASAPKWIDLASATLHAVLPWNTMAASTRMAGVHEEGDGERHAWSRWC